MKRFGAAAAAILVALVLFACGEGGDDVPEASADSSADGILLENAFYYTHVDGHGGEREIPAFVMFEYEQLENVKYQVAYIACTCRGPEVNYWSVAFVEIDKATNTIDTISFGEDSSGHYTAGMYGDSVITYDGVPVAELFLDQFVGDYILGKSEAEIDAYEVMHGAVDAYTGATVTPNNAMRMLQGLFEYHKKHYSS